jgi:hypothetical protein
VFGKKRKQARKKEVDESSPLASSESEVVENHIRQLKERRQQ